MNKFWSFGLGFGLLLSTYLIFLPRPAEAYFWLSPILTRDDLTLNGLTPLPQQPPLVSPQLEFVENGFILANNIVEPVEDGLVTPVIAVAPTPPLVAELLPVYGPELPEPIVEEEVEVETEVLAAASSPTPEPTTSPTTSPKPTNSATPKPTVKPTSEPTPTSTPTIPANVGGLDADKIFRLVNDYWASKGLPPVEKDERACEVARSRAPEIYAEIYGGYMHKGIKDRNLSYWNSEIIISMRTEEEAVNWWINDHIHRVQMEGDYKYSCAACHGNACVQEFTNFQSKS